MLGENRGCWKVHILNQTIRLCYTDLLMIQNFFIYQQPYEWIQFGFNDKFSFDSIFICQENQ